MARFVVVFQDMANLIRSVSVDAINTINAIDVVKANENVFEVISSKQIHAW